MLKHLVRFALPILIFAVSSLAQSANGNNQIQTEVESVLRAQQDAWNHHDLRQFKIGRASCRERVCLYV